MSHLRGAFVVAAACCEADYSRSTHLGIEISQKRTAVSLLVRLSIQAKLTTFRVQIFDVQLYSIVFEPGTTGFNKVDNSFIA